MLNIKSMFFFSFCFIFFLNYDIVLLMKERYLNTGEMIKEARKKAGLTQKELGKRLGVSASMIAQYENSTRKPKLETLKKIALALDSSIDYFIPLDPQSNDGYDFLL